MTWSTNYLFPYYRVRGTINFDEIGVRSLHLVDESECVCAPKCDLVNNYCFSPRVINERTCQCECRQTECKFWIHPAVSVSVPKPNAVAMVTASVIVNVAAFEI